MLCALAEADSLVAACQLIDEGTAAATGHRIKEASWFSAVLLIEEVLQASRRRKNLQRFQYFWERRKGKMVDLWSLKL